MFYLFFIFFFPKNDMEEEFPGIDMVILTYMDDIAISITSEPNNPIGRLVMQSAIELVNGWIQDNGMKLSTNKTKILHCYRKHICEVPYFIVNISLCDKAKFLGVYFDSKLLWRRQINENRAKGKKTSR
jgi:hypothetical protein